MPTTTRYSVIIDATKDNNGKMTYATVSPPTKITGPPIASMSGPPPGVMSPSRPSSALLQAIQKGTTLKAPNASVRPPMTKASVRPPMTNEKSTLLGELKKGVTLRKASTQSSKTPTQLSANQKSTSAVSGMINEFRRKMENRSKTINPSGDHNSSWSGGSYRKKSHVTRRNRR